MTGTPSSEEIQNLNRMLYSQIPWFPRMLQIWRPALCPMTPVFDSIPRGSDVLDFGCGRGMLLLNLYAAGWIETGLGLETSKEVVEQACEAKELLAEHLGREVKVEFEHREPEAILELNRKFDTVVTVDVLHHIPVELQSEYVSRLMALVKDGGIFVYKDMCRKPSWRALANRCHDLAVAKDWINYFPIESWQTIINAHPEWSQVKIEKYSRLWYGHELAVAKNTA